MKKDSPAAGSNRAGFPGPPKAGACSTRRSRHGLRGKLRPGSFQRDRQNAPAGYPFLIVCMWPNLRARRRVGYSHVRYNTSGLAVYVHAFFNQVAQSVACAHHDKIEQRCCRWLLMTRDRMPSDEFLLTQGFLGINAWRSAAKCLTGDERLAEQRRHPLFARQSEDIEPPSAARSGV
jgi:hypothetical protein